MDIEGKLNILPFLCPSLALGGNLIAGERGGKETRGETFSSSYRLLREKLNYVLGLVGSHMGLWRARQGNTKDYKPWRVSLRGEKPWKLPCGLNAPARPWGWSPVVACSP